MKGLSRAQMGLLGLLGFALFTTLAASLIGAWVVAAGAATISFGIFSLLIIFTLAALTRSVNRTRGLIKATNARIRETAAGVRRIDSRTAERFKALDSTELRVEAAERRVIATLEAHRHHVEDALDQTVDSHESDGAVGT